jgi:hypothetical protein
MPTCRHESLEFVGDQKTDDGVNIFYKCTACGDLLVVTHAKAVYGVKGVERQHASSSGRRES